MAKRKVTAADQFSILESLKQKPAAAIIDVSARTIRDLNPPQNRDGTYNATKLVAWHVSRLVAKAGDSEYLSDLERKTKAEADLKEIAVNKELGLWVDKEKALRSVKRGILESRGILETMRANIMINVGDGGEFSRETVEKVIDGEVRRALKALREGERIGDS